MSLLVDVATTILAAKITSDPRYELSSYGPAKLNEAFDLAEAICTMGGAREEARHQARKAERDAEQKAYNDAIQAKEAADLAAIIAENKARADAQAAAKAVEELEVAKAQLAAQKIADQKAFELANNPPTKWPAASSGDVLEPTVIGVK